MSPNNTEAVLAEVRAERARQTRKWGEQNLPDGTEDIRNTWALPSAAQLQQHGAALAAAGRLTYADVLLEEVLEALEETSSEDSGRLRAELLQVAAVAVQWVEAIDRRERLP